MVVVCLLCVVMCLLAVGLFVVSRLLCVACPRVCSWLCLSVRCLFVWFFVCLFVWLLLDGCVVCCSLFVVCCSLFAKCCLLYVVLLFVIR